MGTKDRLENPGPRELACVMETSRSAGEHVIFAVNADIAKAHRRVLVRPHGGFKLAGRQAHRKQSG